MQDEKTDAEIETDRLERLAEWQADGGEELPPGSFGFHEAFHTASVMAENLDRHLLDHPAIIQNADLYRQISRAFDLVYAVYQQMGAMGDSPVKDR